MAIAVMGAKQGAGTACTQSYCRARLLNCIGQGDINRIDIACSDSSQCGWFGGGGVSGAFVEDYVILAPVDKLVNGQACSTDLPADCLV